jgi:hypothetical protein
VFDARGSGKKLPRPDKVSSRREHFWEQGPTSAMTSASNTQSLLSQLLALSAGSSVGASAPFCATTRPLGTLQITRELGSRDNGGTSASDASGGSANQALLMLLANVIAAHTRAPPAPAPSGRPSALSPSVDASLSAVNGLPAIGTLSVSTNAAPAAAQQPVPYAIYLQQLLQELQARQLAQAEQPQPLTNVLAARTRAPPAAAPCAGTPTSDLSRALTRETSCNASTSSSPPFLGTLPASTTEAAPAAQQPALNALKLKQLFQELQVRQLVQAQQTEQVQAQQAQRLQAQLGQLRAQQHQVHQLAESLAMSNASRAQLLGGNTNTNLICQAQVQTIPVLPADGMIIDGERLSREKLLRIYELRSRKTCGPGPLDQASAGRSLVVAEMFDLPQKTIRDIWARKTGAVWTYSGWTEEERHRHWHPCDTSTSGDYQRQVGSKSKTGPSSALQHQQEAQPRTNDKWLLDVRSRHEDPRQQRVCRPQKAQSDY